MSETGAIHGVVKRSDGQPIAEANVLVVQGPSHPDLAALTDESGAYQLGNLAPGQYVVRATTATLGSTDGQVSIAPGGTARLDFVL